MITKRRLNIALAVLGVIVVVAVFIAARAGGSSSATGDATACNAYWAWYDSAGVPSGHAGTAINDAYKEATTQPLISDLHALSEGLQGNTQVNTTNASNDISTLCDDAGFSDPAT